LLDSFRRGQRWLSLIFVSVIGLVFVFFLGVGGGAGPTAPTGNVVVQLDDIRLTERDFAREKYNLEAQLREELGDAYDQVGADRYIDGQALGRLMNSVILAAAAEEMGLHVTQDELRRVVQTNPNFVDENGRFSSEAFDRFAAYQFGSQRAFIQSFTRSLLGQKLISLLVGQTTLSDGEVDLQTRYELEEVRIAYVPLDTNVLATGESLDDDEVEAYAVAHDESLRSLFAERSASLSEPARVRARHVLILVAADASDEEEGEARGRADAARERILAGEDFAAVASEVSEDVSTAPVGGEMGLFAHGDNHAAIDDTAFALEVGTLSNIVRSAYGFHILRVDEKIAAAPAEFELYRLSLALEEATQAAALDRANQIAASLVAAIESGISLEDAARIEGLTLERPAALKRRGDGFVPGLGAAPDLLATAFTLPAGESSNEIFELPGRHVLLQVLERVTPGTEEIASERSGRRERALVEKQNRVVQTWINDYRIQLEASGRLTINPELALGS
jgi:peptidyl-prolyl cis-trans isomerase D